MNLKEICREKAATEPAESECSPVKLDTYPFSLIISDSIEQVTEIWDAVAPPQDLFLNSAYLSVLEQNPPKGMSFAYLVFLKAGKPTGLAYCQIEFFKASESLKIEKGNSWKDRTLFTIKNWLASMVSFYTLACGNVLVTGEHGFYFNENEVNPPLMSKLLEDGLEALSKYQKKKNKKRISVILVKDFFQEQAKRLSGLRKEQYTEFSIQPTMMFPLEKGWKNFDDYLEALTSKYRVRVRRAFKKAKSLEKIEFTEELIHSYLPTIEKLYKKVADTSDFNVVKLDVKYLLNLKKELGERFKLVGYFDKNQLIAFYTTIINGDTLEAHYLGLESSYNRSHQLYLTILLEMVKEAIEKRVGFLHFARTALEIKSSVGAEAFPLRCFVRHRNSWLNRLVPFFLEVLNPKTEWVPRSPFKKD